MKAVAVSCNSKQLFVVGSAKGEILTVSATGNVEGPQFVELHVNGMNELDDNRSSHTTWAEGLELADGDSIELQFVEIECPSPPIREVAADSEEHLAEQRWYDEQVKTVSGPPPIRKRIPSGLRYSLSVNSIPTVKAVIENEEEFISFNLVWNKYHPNRCRISLRSFSSEGAWARKDARSWFDALLGPGESVSFSLSA